MRANLVAWRLVGLMGSAGICLSCGHSEDEWQAAVNEEARIKADLAAVQADNARKKARLAGEGGGNAAAADTAPARPAAPTTEAPAGVPLLSDPP